MHALLRLDGVAKQFGAKPVLRDVDLAVTPGQSVGVVGANGSGKSTLLRIVAGVSAASAGVVAGRPTRAYVPDRFPARQRMSARAYLRHMGRIRGMTAKVAKVKADELLERFALARGRDTALRELSKGNAQKVGLAQALLTTPQVLVLDEPWSGLDVWAREVLTEVIAEVLADGCAVVFTDHRPDFVSMLATRPYRLDDGTLVPLEPADDDLRAKVVLRGGSEVDWSRMPGVAGVHADDHRVELAVHISERDALLLTALQEGWSVVAVEDAGVRR